MTAFARHGVPFFHCADTKAAISAIADSGEIVIYCGAGVTIDRTDLNWRGLIERVFADPSGVTGDDPSLDDIRIMMKHEDPQRVASSLHYYRKLHDGESIQDYLIPRIQQHLYRRNGWQVGTLTQSIVRMAHAFAQKGRIVTIVTTNYDTYLEDACRTYSLAVEERGGPAVKLVTCALDGEAKTFPRSKSTIRLVYLHGRVPKSGSSSGRLVLSETDYIDTRMSVVETLSSLFSRKGATVLVLGSSLGDPPLIEALGRTRSRADNLDHRLSLPHVKRYAVMPMSSTPYSHLEESSALRLSRHMQARCGLLGLNLLLCDFNFQTGLFCQEVIQVLGDGSGYGNSEYRYERLLEAWWGGWSSSTIARNPNAAYLVLKKGLEEITAYAAVRSRTSLHESFKLELWVRRGSVAGHRILTLWSSTTGPIFDLESSHCEDISLTSRYATVNAFVEGRPQYRSEDSILTERGTRSSWRSFLSVPVYVPQCGSFIPVGVVTLATSRGLGDSVIQLYHKQMSGYVQHLQRVGFEMLTTEELDARIRTGRSNVAAGIT